MQRAIKSLLFVSFFISAAAALAHADGFIIVHPPRPHVKPVPLAVKYHHVDVRINDRIATTEIDQVFVNPNNMRLEGTYIFPLPQGASVSRMSMWIDGIEVKAELLARDEANRIYTDIVRKMKDPAILEYMGDEMFKVRIFPIEPRSEKRVKIEYSEKINLDSGLITYRYPLSTEKFSSSPLDDVVINVDIKSVLPIKSVFSPSHPVDVVRKSDHEAKAGFEAKNVTPDKDFILYCTVSDKPFGAALAARKQKTQDGYYALFIAPAFEMEDADIMPKDMVFVIDTSGSMKASAKKPWKIDQAKGALRFCINSLNANDRFNIVSFSTGVRTFRNKLQPVDNDTRVEAIEFVEAMDARGGTNIHEALKSALAMNDPESSRPFVVIFLTDGQPTAGDIQKEGELVEFAHKSAAEGTRLFVFGVGHDVNTHLLDKLAEENRGDRIYVGPEESIELKVAGFYDKIAHPVMSDLEIKIDGIETYDVYPSTLPDLFKGSQLALYGRYTGSGHTAVRLLGKVREKQVEFVYEVVFPEISREHESIPRLWAFTKVGYLLDQLRLKGVNVKAGHKPSGPEKELVDEIVALATEFGIVTPYTALLVVEDSKGPAGPATPTALRMIEGKKRKDVGEELEEAGEGLSEPTGAAAFEASKRMRRLKSFFPGGIKALGEDDALARALNISKTLKRLHGKTFVLVNGIWYDSTFKLGEETTKVKFLSDAYFELVTEHEHLAKYLSVGNRVVVRLGGGIYEIM